MPICISNWHSFFIGVKPFVQQLHKALYKKMHSKLSTKNAYFECNNKLDIYVLIVKRIDMVLRIPISFLRTLCQRSSVNRFRLFFKPPMFNHNIKRKCTSLQSMGKYFRIVHDDIGSETDTY